jgi:prepilin-type N-terminal cleavage/methylation domain-containing protein
MAALIRMHGRKGFTLIEIIVGIVVSAILAVLLSQIVGAMTTRSYWAVQRIDEKLVLQEAMNNICADHRNLLITDTNPLITLQGRIAAGYYWTAPFSTRALQTATNQCIEFNAGTEVSDPDLVYKACNGADTILKVTLQVQGGGQRLTALFTR